MRISTNSIFDDGGKRLSELQAQLSRTGEKIAAGKKVLTPAEDPMAAASALEVQQSLSINDQFAKNRASVKNTLGTMDGSLQSMLNTLNSMKEQVIAASNGVLSTADRASIGEALSGQLNQLMSLANSTDGAGHYMFSGLKTDTAPFVMDPATQQIGSYQGDANTNPLSQQLVQVDSSRAMATTVSGKALFADQGGGDIFQQMQAAIADLKNPAVSPASLAAKLNAANGSLDQTLSSVTAVDADIGTNLQQLDALDAVGGNRKVQYAQTLSDLQALDYNQALSELSQQQLALTAAQKSFQQISQLSLFNYIS